MIIQQQNSEMNILGLMSGTSLDGLDLALVNFWIEKDGQFRYKCIENES